MASNTKKKILSEEHKKSISDGLKKRFKDNPPKRKSGKECNGWKGGTGVRNGYRWVYVGKYELMQEHRYVMEKYLGRKLLKEEIIHHINRDKLDNRIENLEIVNRSSHMKIHIKEITEEQLRHREISPEKFTGNTKKDLKWQ